MLWGLLPVPTVSRGPERTPKAQARTRGQGCCCPQGVPLSVPPVPPWMARDAEKRSRSALRVTEAAAAASARYCVSLERQSLCTEAQGTETPRAWVRPHGGHSCEPPLCSLRAPAHPGSPGRVGSTASFAPSPRAAPGCGERSEPPRGQAGGYPERAVPSGYLGQPLWPCGSWDRARAPSSGTGAGDGMDRLEGMAKGPGRVTKGLGGDCE